MALNFFTVLRKFFAPKMILGYWGVKARGEQVRLMLEYLGLNYENKDYANGQEWYQEK